MASRRTSFRLSIIIRRLLLTSFLTFSKLEPIACSDRGSGSVLSRRSAHYADASFFVMTIFRFPPMFRCSRSTSVACSFIRIATRTHSVFAPGCQIPPDFLVPRGVGARSAAPSASISARRSNRRNWWARSIIAPESPQQSQTRSFAASARQNATRFALNPRKDDDGNDMTLEMTPRAAKVEKSLDSCKPYGTRLTHSVSSDCPTS